MFVQPLGKRILAEYINMYFSYEPSGIVLLSVDIAFVMRYTGSRFFSSRTA